MNMLDAALWYQKNGFNVIPAKKDKRPFVKWQSYQDSPADESQLRKWWAKWPNANVAIITGKRSDLTVIDADSEAGRDAISQFLPDSALIPTVKTPKGWHYYFKYLPKVSNGVRVLTDCDIRTEGGYIIAPPSKNGSKHGYVWLDGLKISEVKPSAMPEFLALTLEQGSFNASSNELECNNSSSRSLLYTCQNVVDKSERLTTLDDSLTEGSRDDTIFNLANHLVKGGMPIDKIRYFLRFFASHCTPPFPEKDIEVKINSALERSKRRDLNLSAEVREWVLSSSGVFLSSEMPFLSSLSSRDDKKAVSKILSRMVNEGLVERVGNRNGQFRKVETDIPKIDIMKTATAYVDLRLPLSLHEFYRPMEKNIILIAGTQDVGKTAFMLNVAKLNMNRGMEIRYCTSEMGGPELRSRLELFEPDVPLSDWVNVDFRETAINFQDMILPDGINIIDYLEISDSFYQIGGFLADIHNKLKKGIAIIALQKDFKSELGRGGTFSLEKPRLYISLTANPPEGNIARIVKCKNWARQDLNPNHRECLFNVIKGCEIRSLVGWSLPSKMLKGK